MGSSFSPVLVILVIPIALANDEVYWRQIVPLRSRSWNFFVICARNKHMDALYQRLKELDPDTFQRLCFHLLKERHPGAGIKAVEDAGGDEGIDAYIGQLAEGSTIWQCKSFAQGVGKSQRDQIKRSLERALRHKPRRWILCLSVNMDAKAHRWFEGLGQSYAKRVEIGLFQAFDIVHELIHRRSLRNHFFPGAALDAVELKRVIRQSGELAPEELERLTEQNIEDFLERLKERDARFNYEVVFSGDRGPILPTQSAPGLMFSVSDGTKTIHAFARDMDALKADPPTVSFRISGAGVAKFRTMIETGKPQEFLAEELANIRSNIGVLPPMQHGSWRLLTGPPADLGKRRLRARVTFRQGTQAVEYSFMEFEVVRAGTVEAEIRSTSEYPFQISIVLPLDNRSTSAITFQEHFVGADVRGVEKFVRARRLLQPEGEVELYDLENNKTVLRAHAALDEPSDERRGFDALIHTLARIGERFRAKLRLPEEMSNEDAAAIELLSHYLDGGGVSADDLTFVLEKSVENADLVPRELTQEMRIRIERPNHMPRPVLFGQVVDTGPCALQVDRAQVKDLSAILDAFRNAAIGDGVKISVRPLSPLRFLLLGGP